MNGQMTMNMARSRSEELGEYYGLVTEVWKYLKFHIENSPRQDGDWLRLIEDGNRIRDNVRPDLQPYATKLIAATIKELERRASSR